MATVGRLAFNGCHSLPRSNDAQAVNSVPRSSRFGLCTSSRSTRGEPLGRLAGIPVAVVLLAAYLWITVKNLRIHRDAARPEANARAWSLQTSLVTLTAATVATAFVSEILVHSLHAFGKAVGLNEFFIAVVIVAIVGNAAEHGGAIVIAKRGNTQLATEIVTARVIFFRTTTLAGWSLYQVLTLLGVYHVVSGFVGTFVAPNMPPPAPKAVEVITSKCESRRRPDRSR